MQVPSLCDTMPAFDSTAFRQALSQFATGVTVVTARMDDGSFVGVTINSFNSVSLQPPLVLWSLAHGASTMDKFAKVQHYVVNVLAGDQLGLARHFARPATHSFDQFDYRLSARGAPLLAGTVAAFECRHRSRYREGDHVIFVGLVERCQADPQPTLGFHRGQFIAI